MALTPQQTQSLHAVIEQRRAALLNELREDVERVRRDRSDVLVGSVPDTGDEALVTLFAEIDRAETNRDVTELRALEAARQRLAEGSYGECADCGGEIGFERLQVNPAAVRCIRCQTAYEKTHAAGSPGSSL
jgi:DnaK suppressor protein